MVRRADYTDEAALTAALQGVDKLLLISSSEVGQRTRSTVTSFMPPKPPG